MLPAETIEAAAGNATDRYALWSTVINRLGLETVLEVGVFAGDFAASILRACPGIRRYYMVDPWRHLDDWNKPCNRSTADFAEVRARALAATAFAADRCVVLEGTTAEVAAAIPEAGIDFAYIDGDHTLRGITIDLLRIWPKIRPGGLLAGDDFSPSIWQHPRAFEPSFVFPWAVHFAEAMGTVIYGLPLQQFAILGAGGGASGFAFRDMTGNDRYRSTSVRQALMPDGIAPASADTRSSS